MKKLKELEQITAERRCLFNEVMDMMMPIKNRLPEPLKSVSTDKNFARPA